VFRIFVSNCLMANVLFCRVKREKKNLDLISSPIDNTH